MKIQLADGLEIPAKSVTIDYPEPVFFINNKGESVKELVQDEPVLILEFELDIMMKLRDFFAYTHCIVPAKPRRKRLIDLT